MLIATTVVWILLKPISLCLIYVASLYEDEEGNVQNFIEKWWIRLDDLRINSRSWSAEFMRETARSVAMVIDYVFGIKPVSFRLLGTSFCFSAASIQLLLAFTPQARLHWPFLTAPFHFLHLLRAFCFLFVGLIPAFTSNRWVISIWYLCLLWQTVGFLDFARFMYSRGYASAAAGLVGFAAILFCMSLLCDVISIILARRLLKKVIIASGNTQVYRTVVTSCLLLVVMLSVLPALLGFAFLEFGVRIRLPAAGLMVVGIAMICTFLLNSVSLFACLGALLFGTLMLLHRLIWPMFQRPIYMLQRYGAVKNKAAVWRIGIALLLLPRPQTMAVFFQWLLERLPHV